MFARGHTRGVNRFSITLAVDGVRSGYCEEIDPSTTRGVIISESGQNNELTLYRLENSDRAWRKHAVLIPGVRAVDSTAFVHNGRFWSQCGFNELFLTAQTRNSALCLRNVSQSPVSYRGTSTM